MYAYFFVYYFILDVTISHIITVKSLIVVIRKPSFFGGGGWTGVTIIWGDNLVWHFVTGREGGGKKCWKKRDIINEWPVNSVDRQAMTESS